MCLVCDDRRQPSGRLLDLAMIVFVNRTIHEDEHQADEMGRIMGTTINFLFLRGSARNVRTVLFIRRLQAPFVHTAQSISHDQKCKKQSYDSRCENIGNSSKKSDK